MLFNFCKKNLFLISVILFFILTKYFLIILYPIDFGSFSYSANTFMYYNFKSFLISPQSFYDNNHPGTPIYYLCLLVDFFFKFSDINKFKVYLIIFHLISSFVYIYCFFIFLNYFQKKLSTNKILIFFLFSFSFIFSIQNLEIADPTNYLFPLALILCVECDKIFFGKENINLFTLTKISFLSILSASIKLTFLPFLIAIYSALLVKLISNKKIYYYILLIFLIILFIIILNFPIIGRLPKILFNLLFIRSDSAFDYQDLYYRGYRLVNFIFEINIYLLILNALFLGIIFFNLFCKKNFKVSLAALIYTTLISISYLYTLIMVEKEIEPFKNSWGIMDLFRNNYLYTIFLIPIFQSIKFNKIQIKILLLFSILAFAENLSYYKNLRDIKVSELIEKKNLFNYELKKRKISFEKDNIAIYSWSGYPFQNELSHFYANSIFAGERFNKEILRKYPNIKFLRILDIQKDFNNKEETYAYLRTINDKIDLFLKNNFNYSVYLILSPKSFDATNISLNNPKRSKDLFIKNSNDKIKYIIYNENDPDLKNNAGKIKNYLINSQQISIKNYENFKVKDDNWIIYELF
jgi:hypothetical protein